MPLQRPWVVFFGICPHCMSTVLAPIIYFMFIFTFHLDVSSFSFSPPYFVSLLSPHKPAAPYRGLQYFTVPPVSLPSWLLSFIQCANTSFSFVLLLFLRRIRSLVVLMLSSLFSYLLMMILVVCSIRNCSVLVFLS